jgi:hypothetical protein
MSVKIPDRNPVTLFLSRLRRQDIEALSIVERLWIRELTVNKALSAITKDVPEDKEDKTLRFLFTETWENGMKKDADTRVLELINHVRTNSGTYEDIHDAVEHLNEIMETVRDERGHPNNKKCA